MAQLDTIYRAGAVGAAMWGDITINYPLWIAAKRIGAGIRPFPGTVSGLYKVLCIVYITC